MTTSRLVRIKVEEVTCRSVECECSHSGACSSECQCGQEVTGYEVSVCPWTVEVDVGEQIVWVVESAGVAATIRYEHNHFEGSPTPNAVCCDPPVQIPSGTLRTSITAGIYRYSIDLIHKGQFISIDPEYMPPPLG